jgi:predicted Fe-Mo cluster-binding NifX family protein
MKIVVTTEGNNLDAPTSPRFGRCPTLIFVETETMSFEAVPNPALSASGGAGIQAAQFVLEHGAEAVLTSNIGPNAADVLQAAGVAVHLNGEISVREAVEAFKAGRLPIARGANVEAHAGMELGRARGQGRGRGMGRGQAQPAASASAREAEIGTLKDMAADLRQQLAEVIDRIEKLEKES